MFFSSEGPISSSQKVAQVTDDTNRTAEDREDKLLIHTEDLGKTLQEFAYMKNLLPRAEQDSSKYKKIDFIK